jgi:hypothetical protein
VPARVAYDNLRAAVVRILVGGARTLTPWFAALASRSGNGVSRIFASWNRMEGWLRQVERLRRAA